jgi:hypothetical protein
MISDSKVLNDENNVHDCNWQWTLKRETHIDRVIAMSWWQHDRAITKQIIQIIVLSIKSPLWAVDSWKFALEI